MLHQHGKNNWNKQREKNRYITYGRILTCQQHNVYLYFVYCMTVCTVYTSSLHSTQKKFKRIEWGGKKYLKISWVSRKSIFISYKLVMKSKKDCVLWTNNFFFYRIFLKKTESVFIFFFRPINTFCCISNATLKNEFLHLIHFNTRGL